MLLNRSRRGASVLAMATLVASVSLIVPAAPAHADSPICQGIPISTPGATLTVAGQDVRVPSISNLQVCVTTPEVPFPSLDTSGNGVCTSGCASLYIRGAYIDAGGVSVSYNEDGVARNVGLDPAGISDPVDGLCLISVGSPAAPNHSCAVALGLDDLGEILDTVNGLVAFVVQLATDTAGQVQQIVNDTCLQFQPLCTSPQTFVKNLIIEICGSSSALSCVETIINIVCATLSDELTCTA